MDCSYNFLYCKHTTKRTSNKSCKFTNWQVNTHVVTRIDTAMSCEESVYCCDHDQCLPLSCVKSKNTVETILAWWLLSWGEYKHENALQWQLNFSSCLSVREYCWSVTLSDTLHTVCSVAPLSSPVCGSDTHYYALHCVVLMWWHFLFRFSQPSSDNRNPCDPFLLSSPRRTLGGIQKSCWTQLNTWATSASVTWNASLSLSPIKPTLPLLSCLSTPTTSPCTPTQPSLPLGLELRSHSPRSNPCDMPHNSKLRKRQHDDATNASWKTKLCWTDFHPSTPCFCLFCKLKTRVPAPHPTPPPCHDESVCNLWPSVPCVLCTACSTDAVFRNPLTL